MRKQVILTSALLLCSPFALADGYSDDPRDTELTTELNTETTVDSDTRYTASTKRQMDHDADDHDAELDVEADANVRAELDTDDGDADFDADADIDVDTDLDERLERVAKDTIAEFRNFNPNFGTLTDSAYGYAVFDTTKGGLIVTGTGGTGVAINNQTGEKTYMRVGGAGLGIGGGLQNYKLVLLFETQDDFEEFTNGDWDGHAAAQAVAIQSGAAAEASFEDGVAAFQMNQKGLMAQADLSGLKFWVADKLQTRGS